MTMPTPTVTPAKPVPPLRRPALMAVFGWLVVAATAGYLLAALRLRRTDPVAYDDSVLYAITALLLVALGGIQVGRPLRLDRRRSLFVAPARALLSATTLAVFAVGVVVMLVDVRTAVPVWLWLGYLAVSLVVLVQAATRVVRGRSRIELSPAGLKILLPYGEWFVPWEAVSAGPRLSGPGAPDLLTIGRSDLLSRRGWVRPGPRGLVLPSVDVPKRYLARVVDHYVEHPVQRAGIGTVDGYHELVAAIGTARQAWRPAHPGPGPKPST